MNDKGDLMTKQVIHIFGASGAGTSTLGKYISDQLGFFFMDTDDYFWKETDPPYMLKRERSDRIKLMKNDIEKHENIVISGSLVDWGDELIPLFTLAVRVETDTAIRLGRLEQRERKKFGARIDIGGDMYENHHDFMEWAAAYDCGGLDMRSKRKHNEWQKQLRCPLILVDGSLSVGENFDIVWRKLQETE